MAAVQIGSSTDAYTLRYPSQRKITRDSSGYYYACWFDQNDEIFLVKSATTTGFTGAETPVEIVGNAGVALVDNGDYPGIVIDDNDILHMIFRRQVESECWYVQWDTSTAMNDSNNWKHADGSTNGAERLCTDNFGGINTPAIAIDSNNYPHVVFDQNDGGTDELFYRRWTGAAWSVADTQITNGSALDCRYPGIAIDGNDHVHIVWRYYEADRSIRYGHSHDFTNWFKSDDTTPITTGASGDEIIDQAGKDMGYLSMAISKHAGTLNDIYVVANEITDDDIMYAFYDKSVETWTVDQDLDTSGVCHKPTVGFDGRGHIYVVYEKDSNIRLARSPDSGTTWRFCTLESTGAVERQAQIEANFDEDDYFGYLFFDSTNGRVYFNRYDTYWTKIKHPMIEQNQKDCFENIYYHFQNQYEQAEYSDRIIGTGIVKLLKHPSIEQNISGDSRIINYIFTCECNQSEYHDKLENPAIGGGGSTLIWLNLPGK